MSDNIILIDFNDCIFPNSFFLLIKQTHLSDVDKESKKSFTDSSDYWIIKLAHSSLIENLYTLTITLVISCDEIPNGYHL